jgi:hypothetical protein
MNNLIRIAHKAKVRMQFNTMLSGSARWFVLFAFCLFVITIVDRVGTAAIIPWNVLWYVFGGLCLAVLLVQWKTHAVTTIEAATNVDERFQLHDRVSSALSAGDVTTPFASTVLVDAVQMVENKNVLSLIPAHFPLTMPRQIRWVILFAVTSVAVLLTPQWGMFQEDNSEGLPTIASASQENIEATIDSVLAQMQDDQVLSEALEEELEDLASLAANNNADPEKLRRDALRNMTDMQKRLEEMLQDENALAFEEVLNRMKSLQLPKTGSTLPMIAAMKNGNIKKAKKEFEKLQQQMKSEELSKEEREALAKELEALGEQMQKLADANEALSSALASAGLNGALANNAEAAKKAIQNAKNLNEAQKKKLLEMLEAQQKASKMCKNIGKGCKSCAGGKQGQTATSELEKMQAMQMFKTKAEMAKSACQKAGAGMCRKPGKSPGTGGEGQGDGGENQTEKTDSTLVAERSAVNTLEGSIIAKQLFEGGVLTSGDSISAVKETVLAQSRKAEQAITDEEVPRRYHDLLRHYFGQLEELTEPSRDDETDSSD